MSLYWGGAIWCAELPRLGLGDRLRLRLWLGRSASPGAGFITARHEMGAWSALGSALARAASAVRDLEQESVMPWPEHCRLCAERASRPAAAAAATY